MRPPLDSIQGSVALSTWHFRSFHHFSNGTFQGRPGRLQWALRWPLCKHRLSVPKVSRNLRKQQLSLDISGVQKHFFFKVTQRQENVHTKAFFSGRLFSGITKFMPEI